MTASETSQLNEPVTRQQWPTTSPNLLDNNREKLPEALLVKIAKAEEVMRGSESAELIVIGSNSTKQPVELVTAGEWFNYLPIGTAGQQFRTYHYIDGNTDYAVGLKGTTTRRLLNEVGEALGYRVIDFQTVDIGKTTTFYIKNDNVT